MTKPPRKTSQPLLPVKKPGLQQGEYDICPTHPAGDQKIFTGYRSLASELSKEPVVIIDGYAGVFFDEFRERLDREFRSLGILATWCDAAQAMKPEAEIERLVAPFLGGDDPLFGTKANLTLSDFFDPRLLRTLHPLAPAAGLTILYGPGASLAGWQGKLVYIDLPKNEIQYRARAGAGTNLGARHPEAPKAMYKRSYFVDWPVLNRHKHDLVSTIDVIVDGQRPEPVWTHGDTFREALSSMSRNLFRARPWFEPGAWGGSWIRDHIRGVNPDVPNYAWSFELITPENGLILESSGKMLEVSFDWLMYFDAKAVLGDCHHRFGTEFPIRFDFLDTVNGGNLSVQVHPRDTYIREQFGEHFTQQESYYILDATPGAVVNLGFREGIDPPAFKAELERSASEHSPVHIPQYIQSHPSHRHDLFLIPDGTVHGSGAGNLVLEISTTPYIFTFKLYDWLRMDLDGNPRDLNIQRGMDNLVFERKGDKVSKEFISRPVLLEEGNGWKKYHLPTHPEHLYDVVRYHISTEVVIPTENKCLVMNLVEGTSIMVITENGREQRFNYAETFVIPAAAQSFRVINEGDREVRVVAAFIK